MFKDVLYLSLILSRPITGSLDLLGYPMIVYESISVMDECNLSPDLRLIMERYDKQVDALFQLTSTTRKFPRKWAALKEKKLTRYSAITCAECIRTVTTAVVSEARRAFPYIFFFVFSRLAVLTPSQRHLPTTTRTACHIRTTGRRVAPRLSNGMSPTTRSSFSG